MVIGYRIVCSYFLKEYLNDRCMCKKAAYERKHQFTNPILYLDIHLWCNANRRRSMLGTLFEPYRMCRQWT